VTPRIDTRTPTCQPTGDSAECWYVVTGRSMVILTQPSG
jgi:hypothetical protein